MGISNIATSPQDQRVKFLILTPVFISAIDAMEEQQIQITLMCLFEH